LIARYEELKGKYEELKKTKDLSTDDKIETEKGIAYLKELNTTISEIQKNKSDLNKAYKKVLEVNKLLDILQEKLKK
jgi:predicted nuclease with TOPRIM domain